MNETKNQLIQTGFTLDRLHQDGKIDAEAYTILKDRNKQAINYSQCCKSDSEQLPDENLYQPCDGCTTSCKNWEVFFCEKLVG